MSDEELIQKLCEEDANTNELMIVCLGALARSLIRLEERLDDILEVNGLWDGS